MKKPEIKGLNVKRLSIILIVIGAVMFTGAIISAVSAYVRYGRIEMLTNDYISTQENIYSLKNASDYLTARARQYVMTGEAEFAEGYFEEISETKRRDNSVSRIKQAISEVGYGTSVNIENALSKSNKLMEKEVYAMSLIAYMHGYENVPEELRSYELSEEDRELGSTELQEKAYKLVFGKDYSAEKLSIDDSVSAATSDLLGIMDIIKEQCTKEYTFSFVTFIVFLAGAAIVFIIIAVSLVVFVLKPLSASIRAIEGEDTIPYCRSYELNYLAYTYNEVYERNVSTRLHLKDKAEHDALTGLLNRGAFDNLKEFYSSDTSVDLAFLIIDVDYFKMVNDSCGHEVGDLALKKVADLLTECFRSNDFPVRYGGDEFAVIMTEITESQKGVIERKLDYINRSLAKADDSGVPKLSVSVGVAFSSEGFTDDLMERADKALYTTKKNGRNGYTFA